jgi:hypothetical protein
MHPRDSAQDGRRGDVASLHPSLYIEIIMGKI